MGNIFIRCRVGLSSFGVPRLRGLDAEHTGRVNAELQTGWTKPTSADKKTAVSFVSWQYALFLPAVVLLYWRLPWRGRIFLLLAGSYFFYGMWDARFLALLLTTT